LFEIDPQLVDASTRKPKGGKSKKTVPVPTQTPAVRKLLSQLQQITSDPLFDEYKAEAQWPAKRNQIAQSQAEKRQRTDSKSGDSQVQDKDVTLELSVSAKVEAAPAPAASSTEHEGEEDADLLGGMFTAVSDATPASENTSNGVSSDDIALRDFGKMSGVSPRKVLEEAVRSRLVIWLLRNH
jgi:ATP-dependent RNA helicase DHX29